MAREAPPQNTIYTGMLAVSLFAVLFGCLLLALELTNDYDWTLEAKGGPAIGLPTKSSPAPAGGAVGVVIPKKDTVTAKASTEPAATPETVPPPAALPIPVFTSAPSVPTPAPKVVDAAQPSLNQPKPTGIVPSPLKLPGDR